MIVENPEAFKAWMTNVLEPLCDADPEALAKYVYALVKKDKPLDELRKCMLSQLEVFLQKDTKDFVDLLFTKLEGGFKDDAPDTVKVKQEPLDQVEPAQPQLVPKLLPPPPPPPLTLYESQDEEGLLEFDTTNIQDITMPPTTISLPAVPGMESNTEVTSVAAEKPVVAVQPAQEQQDQIRSKPPAKQPPEISNAEDENQQPMPSSSPQLRNGSFGSNSALNKAGDRRLSPSRPYDCKSDSQEKDDKGPSIGRRRDSSGSPDRRRIDRSRSRSWDRKSITRRSRSRSRRSRSRGRERERSRSWRNKSPVSRTRRPFDRDRKMRSWSNSPPIRSRSRSPVPRSRFRLRRRSPSRSHSPYDSPRRSPFSRGATPNQDSSHGEDLRHTLSARDRLRKRRCRDYEEKGYCMRGELCPYDHGKDPVVLEDVGQVLSYSGTGVPGHPPPPGLDTPPPALAVSLLPTNIVPGLPIHHRPPLMSRPPPNLSEYNPDAPSMEPRMWTKQPFRSTGPVMRAPVGFQSHSHHQRELISVPVLEGEDSTYYRSVGNAMKRPCPSDFTTDTEIPLKQRFDYSRLGSRRGNCSLQLRKIPSGLNNIAHLHNHFVKFGKIVNIQVCFEGDPEGALITFTSHAEASAAYKSTEAVLNNRFIKVFWYNPDKDVFMSGANITKTVYVATTTHETIIASNNAKKVLVPPTNITKELDTLTEELIKKKQEVRQEQKPTGASNVLETQQHWSRVQPNKEALKLTKTYLKKKADMLEEIVNQNKIMMEIAENPSTAPERKVAIIQAIKALQDEAAALRDLNPTIVKPASQSLKMTPQMAKKNREETQKQILDAELDLFNQQQEGKDTSDLQQRVMDLRKQAMNLGLINHNTIRLPRGGGRFRPTRPKGSYSPHATVDHRPTKLLVSGFESDDKTDVLEHFSKFGEIAGHIWDEATPALVIQFKTRKDAETAMAKGRNFQDRLMSVTWFTAAQSMGMRGSGMRSVILLNDQVGDLLSEHEDEEEALRINIEANEDLLLQDEEEDEDEDRSWRR